MRGRTGTAIAMCIGAVLVLAGCGLHVPADPNGTTARVEGSVLRAGAVPEPGLVEVVRDEPAGPLVDMVDDFAREHDASVDWTVGGEEMLVTLLEEGELDLVVGGITAQTPWADRAAVTRGYPQLDGADGREIVMLVPLGENRFLSEVEMFLDEEVAE